MNRRQLFRAAAGAAATAAAQAQQKPAEAAVYNEKYRPQFHFSPKKGWTNDPNGLVFYKGKYHLFFQHNPFDVKWGNMTWGHATSPDMVHWTQHESAIVPDKMGTIFSGSAVVDWNNTAGFQQGAEKTIVCIYTAAGGTSPESQGQPFTQCIAYSSDGGATFTKYAGNPVVANVVGSNRDPKVVWHEPTRRWIMALFLDANTYGLLNSPDLKHWTLLQTLVVPGVAECPDFFEMKVDDEPGAARWVMTGANGNYVVGSFDGRRFTPEVLTQPMHAGPNYYAVQTFSDLAGGRRVQMSWMNGGRYPDMPFNQQMSFPYELTLRKSGYRAYRLYANPIGEIESLRGAPQTWKDVNVAPGVASPLGEVAARDGCEIIAVIEPGAASQVGLRIRGHIVAYKAKNTLVSGSASTPMGLQAGRLTLRVLVDRASVEVFGNQGEAVIPSCFLPDPSQGIEAFAAGGPARLVSLGIYPLKSIWA
jgi:fructan beta-fructosidase